LKNIFVYTENFRLFYLLAKKFKEEVIPWIPLDSFNELSNHEAVLISTQKDIDKYKPSISPHINLVLLDETNPIAKSFLLVLQAARSIGSYKEIIIAIDPGSQETGVALFLDSQYITSDLIYNKKSLADLIKLFFETFKTSHKTIKIGNGYPRLTKYFLKYFFSPDFDYRNIEFFIIDEQFSSKHHVKHLGPVLDKHQNAAIAIALRKGRHVDEYN
jgi:hypothetical protein